MADKNARRAQKKREKQKKKRALASRARADKKPVVQPSMQRHRVSVADAVDWPVGDCYLSSTWHERGAKVHGGFVREHVDGRMAAVFFAADLENGGISDLLSHGNVSAEAVQGEMARRSELAGHAMMVAEAHLVVKVFRTAHALAPGSADVKEAMSLFGPVDGSAATYDLLTGSEPPPPPKKKSLFSRLFGS